MTAPKFPPHTFDTDPVRWTFKAGGSVAHVTGSRSIACERCRDTSTATPADVAALAVFLTAHAGPVCGSMVKATKTSRRAA